MFAPSKLRTHLLQAQAAGYRPQQILDGSGISWDEIDSLQPVGLDTIATLFDLLARRTHPGFAIAAGHASTLDLYGVVGAATMSMPTLRAAFSHWSRYYLVSGDPIVTSISEQDDHWRMHFEPRCLMSAEARRFCIETSIAALEPVIKQLTDATASTFKIEFASKRPSSVDDYRVFGTDNIRFNQSSTTYYGRRSDLDRNVLPRSGSAGDTFLRHCDEYLASLTSSSSISDRLDNLMCVSVGSIPSLEQMSNAMGVNIRTLQRELRAQNMSYQELVRRYRLRQAKVLLRGERPVIKEVAYQLGFKDAGSFRRAFHSWTGKSVGTWQREHANRCPGSADSAVPSVLRLLS